MTEPTARSPEAPQDTQISERPNGRVPLGVWIGNIMALVLPFAGLVVGICLLWVYGFSWVHLGLLLSMYVLTVLGITIGFHRLFTHRSFETSCVVQCILAVLGSMALQGPLLRWVALHRAHHQHSDMHDDPHSPLNQGQGFASWLRGAWHAHIGWFFDPDPPDLYRYVSDLQRSRLLCVISNLFPLWVTAGLIIPAVIGGLFTHTWSGAMLGLIWGGLIRIFLVHHVTWSINSICHLWGRRTYKTKDQSRNNFLFGILALGEGWHNNHHAFPVSARHGLKWWEFDLSYEVIRLLALFGIVWKVRVPPQRAMAGVHPIPTPL